MLIRASQKARGSFGGEKGWGIFIRGCELCRNINLGWWDFLGLDVGFRPILFPALSVCRDLGEPDPYLYDHAPRWQSRTLLTLAKTWGPATDPMHDMGNVNGSK